MCLTDARSCVYMYRQGTATHEDPSQGVGAEFWGRSLCVDSAVAARIQADQMPDLQGATDPAQSHEYTLHYSSLNRYVHSMYEPNKALCVTYPPPPPPPPPARVCHTRALIGNTTTSSNNTRAPIHRHMRMLA